MPMTRILQKHLRNCIGKRHSEVKPRQKRRIIAPAKLMKYYQYGRQTRDVGRRCVYLGIVLHKYLHLAVAFYVAVLIQL